MKKKKSKVIFNSLNRTITSTENLTIQAFFYLVSDSSVFSAPLLLYR